MKAADAAAAALCAFRLGGDLLRGDFIGAALEAKTLAEFGIEEIPADAPDLDDAAAARGVTAADIAEANKFGR